MTVALANQDQEDEQSCFSDNTHIDIIMNFMGIKNVYLGTYTSTGGQIITGYSLSELVKSKDQVKDQAVLNALLSTESKVNAILPPFDQLIAMGDPDQVITKAIDALRQLSDRFADAAFLWRKNGQ
jgi:putative iron-regulated protein